MKKRFEQLRLRLVGDDDIDTDRVQREFPAVRVERAIAAAPGDIVVHDYAWRGAFDLGSLDEKIEQAGPSPGISVRGYGVTNIACEVMTRYQRLLDRRNDASASTLFDGVLAAQAALFDTSDPIANAELEHLVDTWQWMLRLQPDVKLAPQLAALFHDIERKGSDPRDRMEHRVPDGQSFKDASAVRAAERVVALLASAGVSTEDAERARDIIFSPERRAGDADVSLLDDADSLSFLSLHSAQYIDYFGVAQTRRKVAYTLSRLGPVAREKIDLVRLRPDLERLLREVAA
jgi:hypothetical protein